MTDPTVDAAFLGCDTHNFMLGRTYSDQTYKPRWLLLHTMVGSLEGTNATFQSDTLSQPRSANYGVGLDGSLVQWVREDDTAYHAGDWYANLQSVGIEHEDGGRPFDPRPDALYQTSAEAVVAICQRLGIPIELGDWTSGKPGIVPHCNIGGSDAPNSLTSCPDGLDWQRIIAMAQAIANNEPIPGPPAPTTSQEDEVRQDLIVHPGESVMSPGWYNGNLPSGHKTTYYSPYTDEVEGTALESLEVFGIQGPSNVPLHEVDTLAPSTDYGYDTSAHVQGSFALEFRLPADAKAPVHIAVKRENW